MSDDDAHLPRLLVTVCTPRSELASMQTRDGPRELYQRLGSRPDGKANAVIWYEQFGDVVHMQRYADMSASEIAEADEAARQLRIRISRM